MAGLPEDFALTVADIPDEPEDQEAARTSRRQFSRVCARLCQRWRRCPVEKKESLSNS
jgi:hypothetical protein